MRLLVMLLLLSSLRNILCLPASFSPVLSRRAGGGRQEKVCPLLPVRFPPSFPFIIQEKLRTHELGVSRLPLRGPIIPNSRVQQPSTFFFSFSFFFPFPNSITSSLLPTRILFIPLLSLAPPSPLIPSIPHTFFHSPSPVNVT